MSLLHNKYPFVDILPSQYMQLFILQYLTLYPLSLTTYFKYKSDWAENEKMRQQFLKVNKYGNDIDDVDEIAVKVSEHIRTVLENKRNNKGFHF